MKRRVRSVLVTATFVVGGMFATQGAALADFVCPVFDADSAAVAHNKNIVGPIGGGDFTLLPGKAGIESDKQFPDIATNDDGAGTPGGDHLSPGDPGYSPLWNTN